MKVGATKIQPDGPDKNESRNVLVTKICFYGKTKQKVEVGTTKIQPHGSDKKKEVTTEI